MKERLSPKIDLRREHRLESDDGEETCDPPSEQDCWLEKRIVSAAWVYTGRDTQSRYKREIVPQMMHARKQMSVNHYGFAVRSSNCVPESSFTFFFSEARTELTEEVLRKVKPEMPTTPVAFGARG